MKNHLLKQTRWVYLVSLLILIVLSVWVIKPFILTILGGLIIGYIFYPVYKWVLGKIRKKWLSAFIVSVLVVLVFTLPFILAVQLFAKEAYVSYILIKQEISSPSLYLKCSEPGIRCDLVNRFQNFFSSPQTQFYLNDVVNKVTQFFVDKSRDFISSLPVILVDVLILLFVIFYTFKDGTLFIKKIEQVLPLKEHHKKVLMNKTKEMLNSTLYGIIIVAFIQGAVAGIGYLIFGVKSPLLLAVFTALAALLPFIGTGIVWFPLSAYMALEGFVTNNSSLVARGIGLMIYGFFLVSLIDNFLRPKIIGKKSKLHPVLVLIGILGGIAAFGIVGVLLGPLIIALFVTFLEIIYLGEHEAES